MTTETLATPGTASVGQWRVISSEWIKFRTLWSCVVIIAIAVAGTIGIGWVTSYLINTGWAHLDPEEIAHFDAVETSMDGYSLAELAIGTLGVIIVTGEYTTGLIRATMAAVPDRLRVLWAKLAVYTVITFVVMMATSFVTFLGGQAFLGVHGTSLAAPGVTRVVIAVGIYLTLVAMLGVAFGALIRNTAGGLAALFGVLLVVPAIFSVLPASWQANINKYLPSEAGQAAISASPDPKLLAPWTGMALFAGYVLVAIIAAAVLMRRRDI